MAEPHFALRFMRRFACVGPACPATCCSGWSIPVDEKHYRSLKTVMPAERFATAHEPVDRPEPRRHAQLRMQPNGDCTLLGEDKLCTTHARYGEAHLPDTCASYPRQLAAVGDRLELGGALSCPEAARLALLDEDGLELDAFDPRTLGRPILRTAFGSHGVPATAYGQYLDVVRETVTTILSVASLSLAARLFLVARFADRTKPILFDGVKAVDEAALARELAAALDPREMQRWSTAFGSLAPSGPRAGFVIVHAFKDRLAAPGGGAFRELVRGVFDSYGAMSSATEIAIDPAALVPAYHARRAPWQALHGARVDAILARYARHYWMTSWYMESSDLLEHAQKLHLRIALLRFLLFGHPALGDPIDADAPPRLDRLAVETVHTFARAIEHQHEFTARLGTLLRELELGSLAQAVFLLAV